MAPKLPASALLRSGASLPNVRHVSPRDLAALLALLVPVGAAGCGSDLGEFEDSICLPESPESIDELALAEPADYLAVREQFVDATEGGVPTATMEWGDACATASDPSGCDAALAALPMTGGIEIFGEQSPRALDVVVTRGDTVTSYGDLASVRALFGTIDRPLEAALLAELNGYYLPCREPNVRETADGYEVLSRSGGCGSDVVELVVRVSADGEVSEGARETSAGDDSCVAGRRPPALAPRRDGRRTVGAYFARLAHLEAASVPAFEQLAVELAVHGAPRSLVQAALRARADEVRHARVMAGVARRFGVRPSAPRIGPRVLRPLLDVALDNATEGCVRETFGALVATMQASRAADPRVRRVFRAIARDETRHARLSWEIDAWARGALGPRGRARLHEARAVEAVGLVAGAAGAESRSVRRAAGLGSADESVALARALDAALWRTARAA